MHWPSRALKLQATRRRKAPSKTPSRGSRHITFCQLNCGGILSKFSHIEQMTLTEWECDILMLSETWLQSSSVIDSFLDIPSFNVFRKDRPEGGRGGGLLVYVKSSLKAHRRTDLEYHGLEYIVLELNLRNLGSCILFCCYRSPSVQYRTFFDELSKALSKTLSSTLFLLGDFNAKHAQWTSAAPNAAGNYFMSVLHDFSLTQCITCPTRYSSDGQHCSTLDLFATNRRDLVQHIDISDPISDHCCVKVNSRCPRPTIDHNLLFIVG